jgi:hypothetical protein
MDDTAVFWQRKLTLALGDLGKALPRIFVALLKVDLVICFIWYVCKIGIEICSHTPIGSWLVIGTAVAFSCGALWIILLSLRNSDANTPITPPGSLLPFAVLAIAPVAIAVLVNRAGLYTFQDPLTKKFVELIFSQMKLFTSKPLVATIAICAAFTPNWAAEPQPPAAPAAIAFTVNPANFDESVAPGQKLSITGTFDPAKAPTVLLYPVGSSTSTHQRPSTISTDGKTLSFELPADIRVGRYYTTL